jgi:regulatory protein
LTDEPEHAQARERALALLARREHSCEELRRKLAHKGFGEHAEAVVAELERAGLASDRRFVEAFVRSRRERGHGPLKVRQELRARGIDPGLAEELVDAEAPEWCELLRQVWARKFGGQPPGDYREWAKQARFLAGRGFSTEQIKRVVGED